jgi:hypothetical protein
MNLNQTLSINPNICTWVFLHSSLHALLSSTMLLHNVTIHNEGVYIPFPSCALKLSNLDIQFYLLALTTLNAFYLLRTRENRSRSIYIIQVRFFLMTSFKIAHQLQGNFKICAGACPAVFCFRAGSLDVGDAPASYSLA